MRDGDRHVVPNPGGGWDVKAENAKRASSHHETQAEAIDRAREIIRNKGGGELSVHGEDGKVREKDTVSAEEPSTDGTGAVNLPPAARTTRAPAKTTGAAAKTTGAAAKTTRAPAKTTGAAGAAGDSAEVVAELRHDGGMAAAATTASPVRSTTSPSFGARLKRLFGRSSG